VPPPPSGVTFTEPYRPPNRGATRVIGTVIDIRQVPVANARVQLRDLTTGAVLTQADTNENGEYAFELDESGTYIVEMVMVDGYIVALSNAGSLARYETMQTVVQLPGRWDVSGRTVIPTNDATAFFGLSSATSITATTLQIASDQDIRPIDSGEAVSSNSPSS
jgi:hypothetical protein